MQHEWKLSKCGVQKVSLCALKQHFGSLKNELVKVPSSVKVFRSPGSVFTCRLVMCKKHPVFSMALFICRLPICRPVFVHIQGYIATLDMLSTAIF